MKKLLLICIVVVGIVFVAGCIGGEKASDSKTSIDSQTNQKYDTQNPEPILKLSDLPEGFTGGYAIWAAPKSASCTIKTFGIPNCTIKEYRENIPIGERFVGNRIIYSDKYGRRINVDYRKLDSSDGLREYIDAMEKDTVSSGESKKGFIKTGQPNIGEYSVSITGSDTNNPDIMYTIIIFENKNSYVDLSVIDEKDKSLNEAIRIAKIIKSRLD